MLQSNSKRAWKRLVCVLVTILLVLSFVLPAGASISPAALEATLAPGESITETKTVDIPELPPRADVIFSFDLTGSMSGIIGTAKTKAIEIMTNLNALGVDINYGVMSYMDYPDYYESYGYANWYGDAYYGDYAYRLDQAVTGDTTAVSNAINGLVQGSGADGPQDYTRIMYESYADTSVGWRPGAKKILVNFGDNVPHDDNLNEGVTTGTWSTGGDPGRDEIILNGDDLDLQTVLNGMATNNVILIECHTSDWPVEWMGGPPGFMLTDYWKHWTDITGGDTYITSSDTLVEDVVNAVTLALATPNVSNLHLAASSGFESWLDSVTPPFYSGPTGVTVSFDIVVKVPEGTPDGIYTFTISAIDDAGVSYGDQTVKIKVVSKVNTPGKVTGGGWIKNKKCSFGFNVKYEQGALAPTGQLEYIDHGTKMNVHSESMRCLMISNDKKAATFDGPCKVNGKSGYKFAVRVEDNSEPGKNDAFSIEITAPDGSAYYTAKGTLCGGNIQIHK